ncbi:XRE family transcriptional regulator [Periweissella cryptocerci]|uniref:XRE family transcriptional regulator n=1 Tax=Periweissella cryptocerci TaxID=2506420 RepID=A0A4P6YRX7_9LACO|nr:helix-turn-helix transcriptional regulator [Periweissella cryptocerci]QBO35401.1 XRE family transcriptional regulator [Periweissella cryptocerci]
MVNKVKELRKEKGLTLKELSDGINMPVPTLSKYENGDREPKLETWQELADYFEVSVSYIMGISDESVPQTERAEQDDKTSDTLASLVSMAKETNADVEMSFEIPAGFKVTINVMKVEDMENGKENN